MTELWVEVEGFPRYLVSSLGRVRGPNGVMAPSFAKGYYTVGMYANGKRTHKTIHSLVAAAFIGPRPTPKHEVNHKDTCKTNNCVDNLEYMTSSENKRHAIQAGVAGIGVLNGSAKLDEDKVREIRQRYRYRDRQHSVGRLAATYGVTKPAIRSVIHRRTWRHVL